MEIEKEDWYTIKTVPKHINIGRMEGRISYMAEEEKTALPQEFLDRMQGLLREEYQDFLAAYEKERLYGLRYNPLKSRHEGKMGKEAFVNRMPFTLTPVEWAAEGFYYKQEQQPGKHIFHEAGAYYIQEPSAMAVVEVLSPKPGERILDLCAAPGGKSTHAAGKMMGEGLLISNEIVPGRAKILSQNIERMGIPNAIVCNETPERLAEFFPLFFDRILVDAPCSGEGMFRKDETARNMWSPANVKMCADRQKMILEQAARMLRPGGILVYSTCTFSVEENEGVISDFLNAHVEFSIEEAGQERFFAPGEKTWVDNPAPNIEHTMRLWPQRIAGEGHFIAKLRKNDRFDTSYAEQVCGIAIEPQKKVAHKKMKRRESGKEQNSIDCMGPCRTFLQEELGLSRQVQEQFEKNGIIMPFGEQVYLLPRQMISLKGMKVVRPGLHLGTVKKNRFEPSHALALYLSPDTVRQHYEMTDMQAESYLRGETFSCDEALKGWVLLTMGGYTIGFGKAGGGLMKNHYPKGLRKVFLSENDRN